MKHWSTLLACLAVAAYASAGNGISGYGQSYALCYVSSPSANSPSAATPELVAGTWTAGDNSDDWTVTTAGRLTYTGSETRAFLLTAYVTCETNAAGANDLVSFYMAKGGTEIAASEVDRKLGAASDHGALALAWVDGTVATNEYFEVFLTIDDDTGNPTVTANHVVFTATGAAR